MGAQGAQGAQGAVGLERWGAVCVDGGCCRGSGLVVKYDGREGG